MVSLVGLSYAFSQQHEQDLLMPRVKEIGPFTEDAGESGSEEGVRDLDSAALVTPPGKRAKTERSLPESPGDEDSIEDASGAQPQAMTGVMSSAQSAGLHATNGSCGNLASADLTVGSALRGSSEVLHGVFAASSSGEDEEDVQESPQKHDAEHGVANLLSAGVGWGDADVPTVRPAEEPDRGGKPSSLEFSFLPSWCPHGQLWCSRPFPRLD